MACTALHMGRFRSLSTAAGGGGLPADGRRRGNRPSRSEVHSSPSATACPRVSGSRAARASRGLEAVCAATASTPGVTNAGVSGDTGEPGCERLACTLDGLPRRPRSRHRRFGRQRHAAWPAAGRPARSWTRSSPNSRGAGSRVLIPGCSPRPTSVAPFGDRFNAIYPELARKYNVTALSLLPRRRGGQSGAGCCRTRSTPTSRGSRGW